MFRFLLIIVMFSSGIILVGQNSAYIYQVGAAANSSVVQSSGRNVLGGIPGMNILVEDVDGDLQDAAYQMSESGGRSVLHVNQFNGLPLNQIYFYQKALYNNEAYLDQSIGAHTIKLCETSENGSNETHIKQINGGGYVDLEREAYQSNIVPSAENTIMDNPNNYPGIYQEGIGNFIFGASKMEVPGFGTLLFPDAGKPAKQLSLSGQNWLEVWQTGGANIVGLYQNGLGDNMALINQENGGNTAVVYQDNFGGTNYLLLEQSGGMMARIYQSSASGTFNTAVVKQH